MSKGGSFEGEICKLLSLWWSEEKRDDIFYRSNASGARYTSRKKTGKDTAYQAGDVTFTDPDGEPLIKNWNIEIKIGYGEREKIKDGAGNIIRKIQYRWDILDLIDSSQKETVFESMWKQSLHDAESTHRSPILIFRRNQRKTCIAMETNLFFDLSEYFGNKYPIHVTYVNSLKKYSIVIFLLKDFFSWTPNIRSYFD